MSKELREFLADWLNWATGGISEGAYRPTEGLCKSLFRFSVVHKFNEYTLRHELLQLFAEQGLHKLYPFGVFEFSRALECRDMHRCPTRLAWVRKQLEGNV